MHDVDKLSGRFDAENAALQCHPIVQIIAAWPVDRIDRSSWSCLRDAKSGENGPKEIYPELEVPSGPVVNLHRVLH